MKKKWFSTMIVLTAALFLAPCAGIAQEADHVTLTIMGRETDLQKPYMTNIFDQYREATGNELDVIAYEDGEFEETAEEQFAEGNIPDVFMHFNSTELAHFDVADNFYYMNDEEWIDDLTDSALTYCRDKDGNVLGLPFWESSVSGCYYNKTIFDSLGLKPAATQAEFDALCQALADAGYTPICWPADGGSWMYQFALDPIFADDPSLLEKLNGNEISYADIPAVTNMTQWIADAAAAGWFGSDYLNCGWDQISPALASGDAAMAFIWDSWFYTNFEADQYTVDDFALMPIFMNTAENGTYEGANLSMMMANKNSEHLDAVLDFFAFCAAPEHYNIAFDGIATLNCFKRQITNIQAPMVTDAQASIAALERMSTAVTRIDGYSGDDTADAFAQLFQGQTDVAGCVKLLDEYRLAKTAN